MGHYDKLWLLLLCMGFCWVVSSLRKFVVAWDLRRVRRRRARAIQQAQAWAAAVKTNDAETWPPRPEPTTKHPAEGSSLEVSALESPHPFA